MISRWKWFFFGLLLTFDWLSKKLFWQAELLSLNRGGAFGLFPGYMSVIWMIPLWLYCLKELANARGANIWGWLLISAGGLGNIVDRIIFGGVRDFICYPLVHVCGNVADIFLVMGVIGLVGESIVSKHKVVKLKLIK